MYVIVVGGGTVGYYLSRDLLEERSHVVLGFADPRDYVIRTPAAARR